MATREFSVGHRPEGVELIVKGRWSPEARMALESAKADRLVLNYALGFNESDLEFLRDLPVRQLIVLDRRLTDLTPIYSLAPTLQLLHVTTDPSLTIDVNRLPHLQDLGADWQQVEHSLNYGARIRRIFLTHYSGADLTPFARLLELSEIVLKDRPKLRSLRGLSELTALRKLGIYEAKNLDDLTELQNRAELEDLEMEACRRISSIEQIRGCRSLQNLNVSDCGDIASVAPLRNLAELETVYAYGTTKVLDGDLTPIADLPRLRELRMQDRAYYQPRVRDIQKSLS